MKKINMISRIILAIIILIIFSIMIINEDPSWYIIPIIISLIVFFLSFPSTIFANKIIEFGNIITNKILKILYYILLPFILLSICLATYFGIEYISDTFQSTSNDISETLSHAILTLSIIVIMVIGIILPYIQAIIINILKKIYKN